MGRIKLIDIADKAQVTLSTVSAALNGTGRVSRQQRQRIIAVADELGYRPNLAAKLLKSQENRIMGLVVADRLESFAGHGVFSSLAIDFFEKCHGGGWRPQFEIFDFHQGFSPLPSMFTDGLAAGCIYAGEIGETIRNWLQNNPDYPVAVFEEPWDFCVRTDNSVGVYQAIRHLAATGHRRIGLICGPCQFDINRQTKEGFYRAIRDFGLNLPEHFVHEQSLDEHGNSNGRNIDFLNSMFAGTERPDAIILSGKTLTSTTIYHLPRIGVRVPEDISIVSICAGWEAESLYPSITSIERDIRTMTDAAMRIVEQRIRGIATAEPQVWIEPKFVLRNSVQPRHRV